VYVDPRTLVLGSNIDKGRAGRRIASRQIESNTKDEQKDPTAVCDDCLRRK
jgi:hypothetical protein